MKSIITRIRSSQLSLPVWLFPLVMLAVCIAAYGLFLPRLGYYWDDWAIQWIARQLGPEGLERYFATNRPYWGELYKITTALIGVQPLGWHIFSLFFRWVTGLGLWLVLRQIWPDRPQPAAWAALLFVVYPGFRQQSIGFMYSHFHIVLSCFLFSFFLNLLAVRRWLAGRRAAAILFTGLALLLSFYNLLAMEYFFVLEIIRPVLLALAFRERLAGRGRWKALLLAWLPYLLLFLGMVIWRAFFFKFQTTNYDFNLLTDLKARPLLTLAQLLVTAGHDMGMTSFGAWVKAFTLPNVTDLGARTTLYLAVLVLAAAIGLWLALVLFARRDADERRPGWALEMSVLGLLCLALAGAPFWLTGTIIGLTFPPDRFTLSFMPGAALLLTGLVGLLPARTWLRAGLVAVLTAAAIGAQFQASVAFMRDWNNARSFFWQLTWRAPDMLAGTAVLANEMPIRYSSDNSLTAPLNWIYAPDNHSDDMSYMFYYSTVRVGRGLPELKPGLDIHQNYLASRFDGSTDQMVSLFYNRFTCLRLLDPELEPLNIMLPEIMRESAGVSTLAPVLADGSAQPMTDIFGAEPEHGWCYYYQKAALAAQHQDWQTAAALGDEAFMLSDQPNDPMERVPFIEAYAHTGRWARSLELTSDAASITPLMQPVMCRLWERIERETEATPEQAEAVRTVRVELGCE